MGDTNFKAMFPAALARAIELIENEETEPDADERVSLCLILRSISSLTGAASAAPAPSNGHSKTRTAEPEPEPERKKRKRAPATDPKAFEPIPGSVSWKAFMYLRDKASLPCSVKDIAQAIGVDDERPVRTSVNNFASRGLVKKEDSGKGRFGRAAPVYSWAGR